MSLYKDASLVMLPSAYKDNKLYSIRPTDGSGDFTFSRGSNLSATRVDASQLIEKGRENEILQSNSFSTSPWTPSASLTLTSGQNGYDGTNDAWLLKRVDANSRYINQNITLGSSVYTYSVYAKPESVNWMYFWSYNGIGSVNAYFDLQNGVVGNTGGLIDATIVAAGNGYYRCTITFNSNIASVRIYPAAANGSVTGGVVGAGIYIQDSQIEQSLVATPYIETGATSAQAGILENTPRFDYSGGATCPSLLLEPSRTNVLEYSEYFDSSYYTKASGTSLDFGYLAPDGTNSAYKLSGNTATVYAPSTINGSYSRSIWARTTSGTGTAQLCSYFGNTNNIFNITEEWQRFEISSLTTSIGDTNFYTADLRGVSTLNEIIIWGAQAENASYPTSYIPTYGVSQTRAIDDLGNILLPNFNDENNYSVMFELTRKGVSTNEVGDFFEFRKTDFVQTVRLWVDAPQARVRFRDLAQGNANMSIIPFATGDTKKICVVCNGTTFKTFVDGALVGTYNIVTPLSLSRLYMQSKSFDMKQLLVFKTSLTDSECIALTTI